MTFHLTNSAVMTRPGVYRCREISAREFYNSVQIAYHENTLETYVGYVQNRDLIRKNTGLTFPLSRKQLELKDGDIILAMCIKYRTDGVKGHDVAPDDFQFFYINFKSQNK